MAQNAASRGYLLEDFRLFHLNDSLTAPVDWHFHAFHKIYICLSGSAGYAVEGQSYRLEPGDVVLVPKGAIHRPEMRGQTACERIIVYISPDFLQRIGGQWDLETCFTQAHAQFSYVLRSRGHLDRMMQLLQSLENSQAEEGFGIDLLRQSIFLQFLIRLTQSMTDHQFRYVHSANCDEKIVSILQYLNQHLAEPLSIDRLSEQFFVSKYHMMRRFKAETGYTIHGYLTEKRLMLAREQLAAGVSPGEACQRCGFGDYSTFSRAYKKRFGCPPTGALNTHIPTEAVD